ncbi:MAG TPA: APC family permease [Ktedonobacteraceae bacterium]|nr:APC family permease [Steroidobacteraceae bacterium]HEV2583664.1 APC family permease [Ktedonobacteraceae bacterium]
MNDVHSPIATRARAARLHEGAIGPWGLAALAIGITSPAMGLYALWGPMQVATGPITPLVFIAAMILVLPTALSYAALNSRAPSAGAASNWLWRSLSPVVGYQAGLAMSAYFIMAAISQPLLFALFFRDLIAYLAIPIPATFVPVIGVCVGTIPVAAVTLKGAGLSVKTTVGLMLIESLVVVGLSATIFMHKVPEPGAAYLAAFDPRAATHGMSGFWAAMILGAMAFAGFDVVSTAAEETRAPREFIPKTILLTVIGIAVFWAVNAWAFTLAIPHSVVTQYTLQGLTPVTPVARAYWGGGSIIVIATALTGITAVYISCIQGSSRLIFALARHGLLPAALGELSGTKRVPRNAVLAILGLVLALDVVTLLILRNCLEGFTWWANALVFFAVITFFGVNVANISHFLRIEPDRFHVLRNLLLPLAGAAMNLYLLYAAFFGSLWSAPLRTGRSVVIACVALFIVQMGSVAYVRWNRAELLSQDAPLGADASPAAAEGA